MAISRHKALHLTRPSDLTGLVDELDAVVDDGGQVVGTGSLGPDLVVLVQYPDGAPDGEQVTVIGPDPHD